MTDSETNSRWQTLKQTRDGEKKQLFALRAFINHNRWMNTAIKKLIINKGLGNIDKIGLLSRFPKPLLMMSFLIAVFIQRLNEHCN